MNGSRCSVMIYINVEGSGYFMECNAIMMIKQTGRLAEACRFVLTGGGLTVTLYLTGLSSKPDSFIDALENTGFRQGANVAQIYVEYHRSAMEHQVKELKSFTRAEL